MLAYPDKPLKAVRYYTNSPFSSTMVQIFQKPKPVKGDSQMSRTCRVGLHGRNNVDYGEVDFQVLNKAKIEVIKVMSQTRPAVLKRIKQENPNMEIITRLYDSRVGTHGHPSPAEFAEKMIPIMKSYKPYCEKYHLMNEPNHVHRYEGWGPTDEDARNFNTWFIEAYDRLKQACPWASLGFPGLAVPDGPGHRTYPWLEICRPAIAKADWLGVHCYWQSPPGRPSVIFNDLFGLVFKYYHKQFPDKVLEILECGNSNIQNGYPISEDDVAKEFTDWLQEVFKYPYINSAAYFILSSQDRGNWEFFSWRLEDGRIKPITYRVGALNRSSLKPLVIKKISEKPEALPPKTENEATQSPTAPAIKATPDTDAEPAPEGITNQNMIDAMYSVGKALGIQPAPWGLLSQSGLSLGVLTTNREAIYNGPQLSQMNISPEARQLVREKLAEMAPQAVTGTIEFTNQNVIDAFHQASKKLGRGDWDLLGKAGFSLGGLAADRWEIYTGKPISQNPYIIDEEKSLVREELSSILGVTDASDIAFGNTQIETSNLLRSHPELVGIPLAMTMADHIDLNMAENGLEQQVCLIWNRYGWLLTILAEVLGIEVAQAIAILALENRIRGFNRDSRLLIRFEAHIFRDKLADDETFNQHFRVDVDTPWTGHQWRNSADALWQNYHNQQDNEWAVFEFAKTLNETAAIEAVAMGIPELLGCNYGLVGYSSPGELFNAFAFSERCQILGLFDLIAGENQESHQLQLLQSGDIDAFVTIYKGSNTSAVYNGRFRQAVAAFEMLRGI